MHGKKMKLKMTVYLEEQNILVGVCNHQNTYQIEQSAY